MRFAIVGTGFVADYYMRTLPNYPALAVAGAWDRDELRLREFCAYHNIPVYEGLEGVLGDPSVTAVVNLTSPESHFEVSMAALDAGKHVYSEKPLAMDFEEAKLLAEKAIERNVILAGAPANALSDAFALTKETFSSGVIGPARIVYAEMEDGPVFRRNWQTWRSESGANWPGAGEFETGCTLEHAGYCLTWLTGLFGPVRRISGLSGTAFRDKGAGVQPGRMGPDFSTACLEFDDGVIARLTCGLCAPRDRSLTIMGEAGTITVADLWDDRSAVLLEKPGEKPATPFRIARRIEAYLGHPLPFRLPAGRKLGYPTRARKNLPSYPSQIDFAAGLQALKDCIDGNGKGSRRLAAGALHVTEAALALNRLSDHDGRYEMTSDIS